MKLRKAVKKIVALGTGATMLGATLFGAMAADLKDYPSPLFVKDGEFMGVIVVGDAAASSDVIGAVDIATNLQYEAKESVPISAAGVSASTIVEGDAFKVEKSGDALNLNEQLTDTGIDTVTDDDLNALAEGTIRNQKGTFKYSQYIDMPEDAFVQYAVDDDQSEDPNAYLSFDDGDMVYMYKVTFPTALESDVDSDDDLDDLDNKKITLIGKEYTILNTNYDDVTDTLTLELMGGALQDTMEEYTSKTYTLNGIDYEVEVIAISGAPEVIMKVNGEVTDKLVEGETFTLDDGTELGIKTILENEGTEAGGGDIVEFYLGAAKVILEEADWTTLATGDSIEVGEDTMDAVVNFEGSVVGDVVKISEIQIFWDAEEDYNVPVGGMLSDLLDSDEKGNLFLENIDFQFAGLSRGSIEEISLLPSSDNLRITLTTKTGGEFSFDAMFESGGDVLFGEGAGKTLSLDPETIVKNQYFVLSEGMFSHLMQVNKFEDGDDQVWFKDIATGDITKVSVPGGCDSLVADPANLVLDGKTYTFYAHCADEEVVFADYGDDDPGANEIAIFTKEEAKVVLGWDGLDATAAYVQVWEEEADDLGGGDYVAGIQVGVSQYSTENELAVAEPADIVGAGAGLTMLAWDSKDDYKDGWSNYGTYVEYDSDDNGRVDIQYPSQEMEVAVYVTSGVTKTKELAGSDGGSLTSTTVNAIPVGTAKLASEISNVASQNMIVVGGPCANSVAATLMGVAQSWPACGEGFQEGKAIIKLYQNGNRVAMLVAGATALDTRRASRVLAEYESYNLAGMEMQVVGTSTTFSDTVVSAVTQAPVVEEAEEDME